MLDMAMDQFNTECKLSCKTMEFKSSLISHYEGYGSYVTISIDRKVTHFERSFSMTLSTAVEALGSALGLWLGLGVLQLTKEITKIIINMKNVIPVSTKAVSDEVTNI